MALLVLAGGIAYDLVWRTALALANAMWFAIAAGFLASALCVRQFPAVAMATFLSLFFGAVLLGLGEAARSLAGTATVATESFSPSARSTRSFQPSSCGRPRTITGVRWHPWRASPFPGWHW